MIDPFYNHTVPISHRHLRLLISRLVTHDSDLSWTRVTFLVTQTWFMINSDSTIQNARLGLMTRTWCLWLGLDGKMTNIHFKKKLFKIFFLQNSKDQPMIGSDIGSGRFLAISVKHRIGKIWLSLPIRVPMFGLMKNSALISFNYTKMPCFLIQCE